MNKGAKENHRPIGKSTEIESISKTDETQYKLTTFVSIIAIVAAVIGVIVGAFFGVFFQNLSTEQNTAKLIYDDMDRMNWSLNSYYNSVLIEQNTPNTIVVIISPIYSDNGIYYSSRSHITLLKPHLARNISIFYSDLQWAELYRNVINNELEKNNILINNSSDVIILTSAQASKINLSKYQLENGIIDAYSIRSQIMDELEKTYNIPKNPRNRFNYYP